MWGILNRPLSFCGVAKRDELTAWRRRAQASLKKKKKEKIHPTNVIILVVSIVAIQPLMIEAILTLSKLKPNTPIFSYIWKQLYKHMTC